jgi:hypothetical protein
MGKSEGKKVLGKPRNRWEGNIKVGLKKLCTGFWSWAIGWLV